MPATEVLTVGRKKADQTAPPPVPQRRITTTKVDADVLAVASMIAKHRRTTLFDYIDAVLREATNRDKRAVGDSLLRDK
jgi:hypothetical protein